MKKSVGFGLAILLLGYGLMRIGVGGALLAQLSGILNFPDLSEAVLEVTQFIDTRSDRQILHFTSIGYLMYIVSMGILLVSGAVGVIIRERWGFVLLWIYVSMHGLLFINFQEINPKIIVLVAQALFVFLLTYLRPVGPRNT